MVWNSALPALRRVGTAHPALHRFAAFTVGSGAGLVSDFAIFATLNAVGLPAVVANLISTSVAITITYMLVTRHSFGASATWRTYGLFFAWYATSAILVSTAIGLLGRGDSDANLLWKLAFVPFTFSANFLFSRWLFRDRTTGAATPMPRWTARRRNDAAQPRSAAVRRYIETVGAHPWIAGGIATTLFFVFVWPLNRAISFPPEAAFGTDFGVLFREHATESLFALSLLCLLRWAVRFSVGVLQRDPHYRRWLAASAAYLVLLLPIFIAIYPGHWVFDEFDSVYGATHFFPTAWQGYLTSVYYVFCLYLIPSAVGIVVVQMVFISIVAGYVVTVVAGGLRRRWLAGTVLVALLSPAVLLNDLYPLRLTAYAFLLLLVVVHLLRRAREPRRARPAEFFALACAVAILAFWRTEGIATLLLLPIGFVVLGMPGLVRAAPQRVVGAVAAGLLVIASSGWISTVTADPTYQFTAMINPLSTMLQTDLQGPNTAADLRAIDAVIDVDALRSMPSYTETPAFWTTGLRPDAVAHAAAFRSAYLDLVVHNPGPFVENRWDSFLAANSQTSWAPQVQVGGINGTNPAYLQKFTAFEASTPFGSAWNLQLKYQTARHLFLLDSTLKPTIGTAIVWNAIPSILVVLLALGYGVIRRRWTLAACAVVVVGGAALVFLAEPAAYFMYFFPVYLVGLVGGAVAVAVGLDRLLVRRGTRSGAALGSSRRSEERIIAPAASSETEPVTVGSH